MEEETAFPIGELLILLATVGQGSAALLNVLLAASNPCTFGACNDVRIEVVLNDDILFGWSLAVVPWSRDCTGNIGISLLLLVDIALVDTNEVGKDIEVVCVVVAAVNVGQAVDYLSA